MFNKMVDALQGTLQGTEAAATQLLYGNDNNAGREFEGEHFYRRFSLGKRVTQGATPNVFEAHPKATAKARRLRGSIGRVRGGGGGGGGGGGEEAGRRYAVKRVRKWNLKEPKKQDLLREVGILRRLDHPNVVTIHQFYGKDPTNFYVVLESLAGGELFDRLVRKESYTEREARDVAKILVDVIGHLHDRCVVHRDLKPASILLPSSPAPRPSGRDNNGAPAPPIGTTKDISTTTTDNGNNTTTVTVTTVVSTTTFNDTNCHELKLTDFGMACCVRNGPVDSDGGVSEFKAPEILLGKSHDKPVDMWSLGCLVYILLSGKSPFFEHDQAKMFLRVGAGDCEFPPECWMNTSGHAKDFIRRLLAVDVDRRMTVEQAERHPWLTATAGSLEAHDLRNNLEEIKIFNAKRKLRSAMKTVVFAKRMTLPGLPAASFDIWSSYAKGEKLGEGSFGTVFRATRAGGAGTYASQAGGARSSWLGRECPAAEAASVVAIKQIAKRGLDERSMDEVINEANVMRELNHPNVVSIYDFYQDDPEHFYMVLELMEGRELFGRIVQKEFYNEAEARDVCKILLGAVKYIHSQGIVHRDLKPENLLLASPSDDTSIRLADFGFANSVRDGCLVKACGTPGYVAPEMLKNIPYKTSVDMWSVGVIIYVLLAGYLPFHDRDQNKMFRAIKGGHFKFHDKYWSGVSAEAKDLITKLLNVDPEARITAREACEHPWLTTAEPQLSSNNLSAGLEKLKLFNALRKFRAAIKSVLVAKRMAERLDLERPW